MLNVLQWQTKTLKVVNVKLDPKNVRIDIDNPSQDAIIQDLFKNEDAMQIVESIAQNGFFSQELPIVASENKELIMLEGNRRLAALKAILNPKLVPHQEAKLAGLVESMGDISSLEDIEVKIAPSRDAAAKIIASIHTIRTRRSWKPLRQAYFYYAQVEEGQKSVADLAAEYPNVDIPEFVKMWEMHNVVKAIDYKDDDLQRKVASKNFPISTLERLYNNTEFQKLAQFNFNEHGQIAINASEADLNKLLTKIIKDIDSNKIDTRVLNKKSSSTYKDYIKEIKDLDIKPTTAAKPKVAPDFKPVPVPTTASTKRGIVPDDIVCTLNYPAVNRVLTELKTLNYRKYPNATHDLIRSFLECSLKAYFDSKNIQVQARGYVQLKHVLDTAKTHFETEQKSFVQVIDKMITQNTQNSYMYSADYLNAINHNHQVFSKPDDVKDSWDQIENLIRYVLNPPK